MYIVITPDQYAAVIKAAKKNVGKAKAVIFLYNKINDDSFEVETADVYIVFRYDPLEQKLFADIGKKISLAAVVASDDQIITHVADQLFTLVQTTGPEPLHDEKEPEPKEPESKHIGATHEVKKPDEKYPEVGDKKEVKKEK